MNEFKTYHPVVNFIYFIFVIGFAMFFMNPVCLCISFLCGFTYSVLLTGRKAIKRNLLYILPLMIVAALINPAFNHRGVTIINYFPNGNPLTLESIAYGFAAAVMIACVICWFSCYNQVMTSDKFIYLFGRIIPSLSLVFSMTLRFVPRFFEQMKKVADARRCIGKDVSRGNIVKRAKQGISILSAMMGWALENAIETADSMKARGYGLPGRTAFSVFTFDKRDMKVFVCILVLGTYTLVGNLSGGMYFRYFPSIKGMELSVYGVSVFAAYAVLCLCPIIIELWEAGKWKALKSRI